MSGKTYFFWRCHWQQDKVVEFMLRHYGICPLLQSRSWRRRLIGKTYAAYYAPRWSTSDMSTRMRQELAELEQLDRLPYHFWHTFYSLLREKNVGFEEVQKLVAEPPYTKEAA